jgi:hypothetical protein
MVHANHRKERREFPLFFGPEGGTFSFELGQGHDWTMA